MVKLVRPPGHRPVRRLRSRSKVKVHVDLLIISARAQVAAQPIVLMIPDTTEVDLTRPEPQVTGTGPLDGGARRGAARFRI